VIRIGLLLILLIVSGSSNATEEEIIQVQEMKQEVLELELASIQAEINLEKKKKGVAH
jgi:hypothetical protein